MNQLTLEHQKNQVECSFKIGFMLFSVLFLVFPYWNGLFFHLSFSYAAIFLFASILLLSIVWAMKRVQLSGWSVIDYLAIGIGISYIIASLSPASYEQAIIGVFRSISYLGVYFLVRVLLGGGISRLAFIKVFAVSGILVSLYGLAAGFGTIQRMGAVVESNLRRLASVFEYSNTGAAYVVVTFLLTLGVMAVTNRKIEKIGYAAGLFVMLAYVFFTYSRGAWLVLAGILLLMILTAPKYYKFSISSYVTVPLIVFFVLSKWLGESIKSQQQFEGWFLLTIGVAVSGLLIVVFELIRQRIRLDLNQKAKWIGMAVLIGLITLSATIGVKYIPQNILARFTSINLEQFSVVQRFVFYKDALTGFMENPVFGNGYQTWKSSYQSFQSYPYVSRQTHGYLMDLMLDIGAIGILLAVSWFVLGLKKWLSNYKKSGGTDRLIYLTILFGGMALVGHALIDFDMAYGTMNFLLWSLMALAVGSLTVNTPSSIQQTLSREKIKSRVFYGISMVAVVGLVGTSGYLISDKLLKAATKKGINAKEGLQKVETGIVLAPYRADLWLAKAQLSVMEPVEESKEKERNVSILKSASRVASLAPKDPEVLLIAAGYSAKHGGGLKAVELFRKAWESGKFHMQALESYISVSQSAGEQLYGKNNSEAKRQFENGWAAYQDAEKKIQGFADLPKILHLEYKYELTPSIRLNAARCAYYLGKYDEVINILQPILSLNDKKLENMTDKAKLLVCVSKQKNGQPFDSAEVSAITSKKKEYEIEYKKLMQVQPF